MIAEVFIYLFFAFLSTFAYEYPFQNPDFSWQYRVNDLVNRLSLEEIVNQTFISNVEGKGVQTVVPQIPRLGIKPFVWKTDCTRGIAHTNATAFPQDIGLAASFRYKTYSGVGSLAVCRFKFTES